MAVIDGASVRVRVGKATPTKVGDFVTVWSRNESGSFEPFRDDDGIGALMVVVRGEGHVGVFSFPSAVPLQRRIVTGGGSSTQ